TLTRRCVSLHLTSALFRAYFAALFSFNLGQRNLRPFVRVEFSAGVLEPLLANPAKANLATAKPWRSRRIAFADLQRQSTLGENSRRSRPSATRACPTLDFTRFVLNRVTEFACRFSNLAHFSLDSLGFSDLYHGR